MLKEKMMYMKEKLIPKVFLWMTLGLVVTFATGYCVSMNTTMLLNIFAKGFHWVFLVAELVLVFILSARVTKMKGTTAKIMFLLYSFVSGLTFSSIFVVYNLFSIFYIFIIAAIIFAIFGAIGYFTNLDLTKFGTFLLMALIGIIIFMIINMFVGSSQFDFIISVISLLVFIGFTAYDVQKIKRLENSDIPEENIAIIGALELYLDYINIFLHLLSIIGDSKD